MVIPDDDREAIIACMETSVDRWNNHSISREGLKALLIPWDHYLWEEVRTREEKQLLKLIAVGRAHYLTVLKQRKLKELYANSQRH